MAAETRNIPTNIDAWPSIANMLPDQKWIFVLLWLKCTNEIGVWLLELAAFAASASVSVPALESALDDFEQRGLLKRDHETGEILIVAWFRWQKFVSAPRQRLLLEGLSRITSPKLKAFAEDSAIAQGHMSDKSTIYCPKESKQNESISTTREGNARGALSSKRYPLVAAALEELLSIAQSINQKSNQDRDFAHARAAIKQLESDNILTDDKAAAIVRGCQWPSQATERLSTAQKSAAVAAQQHRDREEELQKSKELLDRHHQSADELDGRFVRFPDGATRRVTAMGITYQCTTYSMDQLKTMLKTGELALC
ncbi:MAG: hypothetical protein HYU74_00180 [Dechloromonas sp.]|nr:hypothetical protein [Dechloromonas sp.]